MKVEGSQQEFRRWTICAPDIDLFIFLKLKLKGLLKKSLLFKGVNNAPNSIGLLILSPFSNWGSMCASNQTHGDRIKTQSFEYGAFFDPSNQTTTIHF